MKGDFTRNTFRPQERYSSVRQQQGRVQLDADWNEALDIFTYYDRTTHIDVIGRCGVPEHAPGYEITPAGGDLNIGPGRFYAHGILCELDDARLYTAQDDAYPGAELPAPDAPGRYLAYLDVWERHITALEDPELREVALGGPDTATRLRIIAAVRLAQVDEGVRCADIGPGWAPPGRTSTGLLAARSQPDEEAPDPCEVPFGGGYRRLENQLYRVEIHTAGATGTATFKWSRENGSVVFGVSDLESDDRLILASEPRDANLGLPSGTWVELTDDTRELRGEPGLLVQVLLAQGREVTVDLSTIADPLNPGATEIDLDTFGPNTKLRRWESAGAETVEVPGSNDGWLPLESGVEVRFAAGETYQTGDYWLIPARTAVADVLWPRDGATNAPIPSLRHGIARAFCPLAILAWNGQAWQLVEDCRRRFPPLTELPTGGASCCTVSVGDGEISQGDYSDIQSALDALPEGGGQVCILPGHYALDGPVLVRGRNIIISGCGRRTRIESRQGPAFVVEGRDITLRDFWAGASDPDGAVIIQPESRDIHLEHLLVVNRSPEPGRLVHRLAGAAPGFGPAVVALADGLTVVDCRLLGLPALAYRGERLDMLDNWLRGGGIWIWDGSEEVRIRHNLVEQGQGAGIVLGGLPEGAEPRGDAAGVFDVDISANRIVNMAGSGIATLTELDFANGGGLGDIDDVTIAGNHILGCARLPRSGDYDGLAVGGIVMENTAQLRIHDNRIEGNGAGVQAACGIYLAFSEEPEIRANHIVDNGLTESGPGDCLDFRDREPGEFDLPVDPEGPEFEIQNFDGNLESSYRLETQGGLVGLNCLRRTLIKLREPASTVTLLLLSGNPATTVIGRSVDGEETVIEVGDTGGPETVTLSGAEFAEVELDARQNEVWLYQICWGESGAATGTGLQAGIVALLTTGGDLLPAQGEDEPAQLVPGGPALMVHDNVVVAPLGPALLALCMGPVSVADNVFTSRGELPLPPEGAPGVKGALVAMRMLQAGRCVALVNLALGQHSTSLFPGRDTSELFTEEVFQAILREPLRRDLPGGPVHFHGNDVTFELGRPAQNFVFPAVYLFGLDDVSVQDNVVRSTVAGAIQLVDVLAMGVTLRAGDNRIGERPGGAYASLATNATFNNTSDNQATHCVLALGPQLVQRDNQVMVTVLCEMVNRVLPPILARLVLGG